MFLFFVGPRGPKGQKGSPAKYVEDQVLEPGFAGNPGADGVDGSRGDKGMIGSPGDRGEEGPRGIPGPKGICLIFCDKSRHYANTHKSTVS